MKAGNILYLAIGIGIGLVAGIYSSKEKYKKIADEEIKSVIDEFNDMKKNLRKENSDNQNGHVVPDKAEAIRKNYSQAFKSDIPKKKEKDPIIEVIDENEFGEYEDDNGAEYVRETLYYYTDGVLADGDNDVASRKFVGDYLLSPGDWKYDAVYIRNHTLKMDIEILKSDRSFEEVKQTEQYYEEE